MAYLTQFSIPALLNLIVNKMSDASFAILLLICSHEVWVEMAYEWSTALCLGFCLCRPSFHSSKLRHKRKQKHKHRKNELVRFSCANMLMLMSTQFSLAIHMCLCLCLGLCASENQGLMQTALFAFSDFTIPVCPYLRLRFAGGSTRLPRLFSFIHSLLF